MRENNFRRDTVPRRVEGRLMSDAFENVVPTVRKWTG